MTTRDPTDLRTIEQDDIAKREKSEQQARQATEDLKWLLAHKQGRRFLYGLLEVTGAAEGRNPFNNSGSAMAFNCGVLSVGSALQQRVKAVSPESLAVMQREAESDR